MASLTLKNTALILGSMVIGGALTAALYTRWAPAHDAATADPAAEQQRKVLFWYDPMYPNTRFNKPGKSPFMDMDLVPKYALTVGVGTLLDAEEVMILVLGHQKALALQAAVEGNVNHMWTITCLQLHPKAVVVCDEPSTMELKVKTLKYFNELEAENIKGL